MTRRALHPGNQGKRVAGFTMAEMMVALGIGFMVLAMIAVLTVFGARSFAAMGNYADLNRKSRYALDVMMREIRQATLVVGCQTTLPVKSLTLTNAYEGKTIRITWYSDEPDRPLVFEVTGQPALTSLTGCDRWDFALYNRTPIINGTNITFFPATNAAGVLDPGLCKLIDMSWKCSRTILGSKLNTETVQSAQIVIRNKR